MTTTEIILATLSAILGGKYLWDYLTTRYNGNNKIRLKRLEKEEQNIENLQQKYDALEAKYSLLTSNYHQLITAFTVMKPLLLKLVENEPEMKASLDVMIQFVSTPPSNK